MRIVNQINPWGRAGEGGEEPQRTDLWAVDLRLAVDGINQALQGRIPQNPLAQVPSYFAQSVALPELMIKAEPVRRDSRSYNMPSWDEPLATTRIVFLVDAQTRYSSRIYALLDRWRMLVRAGRGGVGAEPGITLNSNYRIDYAFSIMVGLLCGGSAQTQTGTLDEAVADFLAGGWVDNDLEYSGQYLLENAWLGSFKMGDLSYEGAKLATIDATFYADNVLDNGLARYG